MPPLQIARLGNLRTSSALILRRAAVRQLISMRGAQEMAIFEKSQINYSGRHSVYRTDVRPALYRSKTIEPSPINHGFEQAGNDLTL